MPGMKAADKAVQSDTNQVATGAQGTVPFLVPAGPFGAMTMITMPVGEVHISLKTSLVGNADANELQGFVGGVFILPCNKSLARPRPKPRLSPGLEQL
jgi:hypothetical protein